MRWCKLERPLGPPLSQGNPNSFLVSFWGNSALDRITLLASDWLMMRLKMIGWKSVLWLTVLSIGGAAIVGYVSGWSL